MKVILTGWFLLLYSIMLKNLMLVLWFSCISLAKSFQVVSLLFLVVMWFQKKKIRSFSNDKSCWKMPTVFLIIIGVTLKNKYSKSFKTNLNQRKLLAYKIFIRQKDNSDSIRTLITLREFEKVPRYHFKIILVASKCFRKVKSLIIALISWRISSEH